MYRIAILFILIGFGVKYGKMYFLIAGYNTMSAKEKAKYDIEGIATLFRNVFFTMAGAIIAASLTNYIFDWPEIENAAFMPTLLIGVLWILIRTNGKKYHVNR